MARRGARENPRSVKCPSLGVAVLLLAVAPPCSGLARAPAPARIRDAGVLRVAIDATYPPMEFLQEGQPVGFDVDLARALAQRLGVRAEEGHPP